MRIRQATFTVSSPDLQSCPPPTGPEFAFIGRSNVGKSSMINLLTGQKTLAKVSSTPGFTKLINFFDVDRKWILVDLPGYGYAKVAKQDRVTFHQFIADYLEFRPSLRFTFVLIDSRLEPQRLDLEFLLWLQSAGRPFALIFTKSDKIKPRALAANIATFKERLAEVCGTHPREFVTSAERREGRAEILAFIGEQIAADSGPASGA